MSLLHRAAQLEAGKTVRADLAEKMGRVLKFKASRWAATERTKGEVQAALDRPVDFIQGLEGLPFQAVRLPFWVTQARIDGLVRSGALREEDVFLGQEALDGAEINEGVPQAFGYVIGSDEELARVITDPEALAQARAEFGASETYPTIYLLNEAGRTARAAYLGGRLPTQDEQKAVWDKLPGSNVLEKAAAGSIPFTGCFGAGSRKFWSVGGYAYLMSSSPRGGGHESLLLGRGDREAVEGWNSPGHGFDSLVVFG